MSVEMGAVNGEHSSSLKIHKVERFCPLFFMIAKVYICHTHAHIHILRLLQAHARTQTHTRTECSITRTYNNLHTGPVSLAVFYITVKYRVCFQCFQFFVVNFPFAIVCSFPVPFACHLLHIFRSQQFCLALGFQVRKINVACPVGIAFSRLFLFLSFFLVRLSRYQQA